MVIWGHYWMWFLWNIWRSLISHCVGLFGSRRLCSGFSFGLWLLLGFGLVGWGLWSFSCGNWDVICPQPHVSHPRPTSISTKAAYSSPWPQSSFHLSTRCQLQNEYRLDELCFWCCLRRSLFVPCCWALWRRTPIFDESCVKYFL